LESRSRATKGVPKGRDDRRQVLDRGGNQDDATELAERAAEGKLGRRARLERYVRRGGDRANDVVGVARFAELRVDQRVPGRVSRFDGLADDLDDEPRLADPRSTPHRDRRARAKERA